MDLPSGGSETSTVAGQSACWGSALPLPRGLRACLDQGHLEYLESSHPYPVPVRMYGRNGGKAPVMLIHGLQSHSGWFAQSAAFLGSLGHPTYAIDRCGSGLSSAPRGDIKDYRTWSAEIRSVAEQARHRHGHERVYLLGHCFGAIPAALFAIEHPQMVRGLIASTPGIHTSMTLRKAQVLKILLTRPGRRDYYLPVSLTAEHFTELPDYQEFIAADALALHSATGDLYWQIHLARRQLQKNQKRLIMPLWAGTAAGDPIARNVKNLDWIFHLPSRMKTLVRYEQARHILEFSQERQRFFNDLAAWLAWVEGS